MSYTLEGHYISPTKAQFSIDPAKKFNLKKYYLQPIPSIPEKLVASWCGYRETKERPARAAQYPVKADPDYESKIQQRITTDAMGFNEDGKLMFVFRTGVIPLDVRDEALKGLTQLDFWSCNDSNRPELKGAVEFNTPNATVEAKELNVGYHEMGRIFKFVRNKPDETKWSKIIPLLEHMTGVYAQTLPAHFREQNISIPMDFRLGLSVFSTVALLKSAPSAVHKDSKNGDNFACMTSVQDEKAKYSGGTFCFVKYGVTIAVKPGDILIASTPRDWHCNLTPVQGLKYSLVAYYKKTLHSPKMLAAYRLKKEEMAALKSELGII